MRLLSIAIMVILSGCADQPEHTLSISDKHYDLNHTRHQRVVSFPLDKDDLMALVQTTSPGKSSVHITIPSRSTGMGKKRLRCLIAAFQKWGVPPKRIHPSRELPPAQDQVTVIFDRYEALPTNCPRGKQDPGTTAHGCAMNTNLLLMLEDPIILFRGVQAKQTETIREAMAISDYRTRKDKEKPLKVEKLESTGQQ